MKKSKLLLFSLSFILLIVSMFCFNISVEVKAETVKTSALISVKGAQVRTSGDPGIRFVGYLDPSYDTTNVTAYGLSIAYGEVAVEDIVVGGTVGGKEVVSAQVSEVNSSNYFYVNLTNIPDTMYGQKVTARAYLVENGEVIYATTKTTRSLGQVVFTLSNAGQTNELMESVISEIKTNYRKTFVDNLGSVYYDTTLYETDHKKLGELFIADWNTYFGTSLDPDTAFIADSSFASPFSDSAESAQQDGFRNSNLKSFFQNTSMKARWSWLLDYIKTELTIGVGYSYVLIQINAINNNSNPRRDWYYGSHLISFIMSIFNGEGTSCGYGRYNFQDNATTASKLGLISNYNTVITADLSNVDLVPIGSTQTLPSITPVTGYTGVYTLGTSQYLANSSFVVPSGNSILTIEYVESFAPTYSITYELNGGSWSHETKTEYIYDFLEDFYAFVDPDEDFNTFAYGDSTETFLGTWNTYMGGYYGGTNYLLYNNDLTADNDAYFLNSSQYKEKWNAIGEWVYDMNGRFAGTSYTYGTLDFYRYVINDSMGYDSAYGENFYSFPETNVPSLTSYQESASAITLPTPNRSTFVGWYTTSDFSGSPITEIAAGTTGDLVLYAKWSDSKSYEITFDSNGGNSIDPLTVQYLSTATLPTPTRDGYEFLGWYYNDTLLSSTFKYTYKESITLTAKWVAVYDITFNSNGGPAVSSQTVKANDVVTLPTITKDGYVFLGWYYNGNKLNNSFTYTYSTDITLEAQWQEIVKYQITFNSNGGPSVSSLTVETNELVTLPTIERDNYTFMGWYYNGVKLEDSFNYNYETDITLVAEWTEIIRYTITFNSDGGTSVNSMTVVYYDEVTLPTITKSGYEFLGWYYNNVKLDETFIYTYESNITLVAKWSEIVTYEILFDSNGGSTVNPITVEVGDSVTLPTPTRTGYEFLGWYYNNSKVTSPYTFNYSESITLTAKWQQKAATLTNLTYSGSNVTYRNSSTVVQIPTEYIQPEAQLRAAWVSSLVGNFTPSSNQSTMKNNLQAVLDIFDEYNLNCMIFHVRAMNDAYYKTNLSPINSSYGTYSTFETWDYLEWLISECHKRGIEFHAWLNPYRIKSYGYSSSATTSTVASTYSSYPNNPASKAENILMTYRSDGTQGAILNPAKTAVQDFIVDTCIELMTNYEIDAIHFDDYFYAQMSSGITVLTEADQSDYVSYINSNPSCGYSSSSATDKKQWRRDNIDNFIYKLHTAMTEFNSTNGRAVQLGIAPTGIYKNGNGTVSSGSNTAGQAHYESYLFCDTVNWINNEWIDYIMPQSYWAFTHTVAGYADVMDWWNLVVEGKNVNLYSGLGLYMSVDGGNYSWGSQAYELSNQILYTTKLSNVKGVSIYSFGSLKTVHSSSSQVAYPGLQRVLNEYWTEKIATPTTAASQYLN